jgi:hypothetical protein
MKAGLPGEATGRPRRVQCQGKTRLSLVPPGTLGRTFSICSIPSPGAGLCTCTPASSYRLIAVWHQKNWWRGGSAGKGDSKRPGQDINFSPYTCSETYLTNGRARIQTQPCPPGVLTTVLHGPRELVLCLHAQLLYCHPALSRHGSQGAQAGR